MPERSDSQLTKRPTKARVVRWEGFGWGVSFHHGRGKRGAYPVGPRDAAEAEAERLRSGGLPRSPSDVIRLAEGQLTRR